MVFGSDLVKQILGLHHGIFQGEEDDLPPPSPQLLVFFFYWLLAHDCVPVFFTSKTGALRGLVFYTV